MANWVFISLLYLAISFRKLLLFKWSLILTISSIIPSVLPFSTWLSHSRTQCQSMFTFPGDAYLSLLAPYSILNLYDPIECCLVIIDLRANIHCKWIYTRFVFLGLGYLTQWFSFMHLPVSFIFFYSWVIIHCVNIPYFPCLFFCWGASRLFPVLAILNRAAMNMVE